MVYLVHQVRNTIPHKTNGDADNPTNRRKENIMTINFTNNCIELTTSEMKNAMTFGSSEYKALQEARRDYPTYRVVEKKIKNKAEFGKLTMKTIKAYVEKHGSDEQKNNLKIMTQKGVDMETGEYMEATSFFAVKSWFLNTFPELKTQRAEHRKKVQEILQDAAEKAAAAENATAANEEV